MKTILVVDDELASAEVLAMILEEEGYRTHCAMNGQRGLEKAREFHPDLIILDFMMPVMDGAKLGETLRADPTLHDVRILMQSGLQESAVRSRFGGYDTFLRKPYPVDELLTLVKKLLFD